MEAPQRGLADLTSRTNKTLVLIGLMGAGKTTVGRRLAKQLGLSFIDADHEIEIAAGCSVEDIFQFHGEEAFRDCERRVIARLLQESPHILATGGGAFMDMETQRNIQDYGLSVWLRTDMPTLLQRVAKRDTRPLLKADNPEAVLERLAAERYPVYAQADIIVDSGEGPHQRVVDKIIKGLHQYYDAGCGQNEPD